ncbi:monocarboxylate transporter 13-like [Haliotis cracherodii]|uniref:monocarboxylate transporter 13-like n=1 Tax=Haliotis cracherodii TaxID=6455 RepID=UPI0039EB73D7
MSAGDVADVTGDFRMATWMCRDGNKGPRGLLDDDNVKSIRHSHRQCVEDSKSVASTHEGTREVTTSKYRQIGSVVSCFVANMFYGGLATSYGVMYTYMKQSLGVSEEEVTWIGALFGGFSGIASIIGVVCVDRLGSRLTTLFGGLLAVTGFIIGSQVNDLNVLYFALGVLPGTGACLTYTSTMVHVTKQFSKWRPVAVGISVTGIAIGMLMWPPLSAVTADTTGWRGTCLINGALTLHFIPCAMLITPRNSTNSSDGPVVSLSQTLVSCLQIFRIPGAITVSVAHITLGFSYYTFSTFLPAYVTASLSTITTSEAALIVSTSGYGSMVGRVIFSGISMASKKAANYIFIFSLCMCGVTDLLVPLCERSLAFYINGAAYGLALGGWNGVYTLVLVKLFGLTNLSKIFGICVMCQGIGAFGGGPLQSYLSRLLDKDMTFVCAGGSFIATMMLMLTVVMRQQISCPGKRQSFSVGVLGIKNDGFTPSSSDTTV